MMITSPSIVSWITCGVFTRSPPSPISVPPATAYDQVRPTLPVSAAAYSEVVAANEIWSAVDALIDGAPIEGVLAHQLGPLAARRHRIAGDPVPEVFAAEERAASFAVLSATPLLRRIRELDEGPLVLLKGPEVAALYPPNGRRFADIDLLAPDAVRLHGTLRQHGFVVVETPFDHSEHHHLAPLRWPVVPLSVEVHEA